METAVANAIVTAATGLEAPAAPAPITAPESGVNTGTSPHVAAPKRDLGESPKPGGKSRDEVLRALADGKTDTQVANAVLDKPNADNAAAVKIVDTSNTNTAGDTSTANDVDGAAPGAVADPAAADASALADAAAAPDAPTQEVLEAGTDVGTGDALFRIRDKNTGQWKAAGADVIELAFRDATTGEVKTYEKTLPELARMARDGVAASKLMPEVKYYRDNIKGWENNSKQLQAKLDAQMNLNRELLSSEEKYLERREQYQTEMSPDKRVERLQAELNARDAAAQRATAQKQFEGQVSGFYQTRVQPVVNEAMKVLPPEMVIGRITTDTLPLMVNGVIPPQHWQQLEAYMRGPFATWAKTEGAKWAAQSSARTTATAAATAAQKAAQVAKQEQARAMQPVGRVAQNGTATEAPVKLPPPKNKREAMERLVSRPLDI